MTISEVLENRNIDGEIYLSDVDIWLEHKIPMQKVWQLRDKLMELINDTHN